MSLTLIFTLILTFIVWLGLVKKWTRNIYEIAEDRRREAVARGESPPDISGSSNYERNAIREGVHRRLMITPREKWIGRSLLFGVPSLILMVFIVSR